MHVGVSFECSVYEIDWRRGTLQAMLEPHIRQIAKRRANECPLTLRNGKDSKSVLERTFLVGSLQRQCWRTWLMVSHSVGRLCPY